MNRYAGFWIRFAAAVIDIILLLAIQAGIEMGFGNPANPLGQSQPNTTGWVVPQFVFFIANILYDVLFWVNYGGATPGKKLMGIKVIQTNGKPLTYPVAIIRWFAQYISLVPLGLGYFWVAFDKKKQGWHDKIASTLVVRK